MRATIFDIQRASMVDGPGVRTSVFFKGCNLRCAWCHNPEGMESKRQLLFYKSRCSHCGRCKTFCTRSECVSCGECAEICPSGARKAVGYDITADELLQKVLEDMPFYRAGNGGVTCSGGECMLQADFLKTFLSMCKAETVHTAVDTAGCVSWQAFESVLPYADMFLYDIKCISSDRHRKFVGVDNRVILENYRRLIEAGARIWVRVPLIPEFNCEDEEMARVCEFLAKFRPEKVEILPYHAMGEGKYAALGKESRKFSEPASETVRKYQDWVNF